MGNRRPPRREGHGARPAAPARRTRTHVLGTERSRPQLQVQPQQSAGESGRPERLQKVLAHAGIGSRRACEEVILQGRVTVDGQVVRELGTRVDPARQKVAVDGQRVFAERTVFYAVNKPKGYVSTNNDPAGRPRVIDILPEIPERVYSIGRLDEQSTGLMILTNDGELANRLTHPKYGVEKLYRVVVAGSPAREVLAQLTEGVWLAEGKVRAKRVRVIGTKGQATILELTLAEGRNREVRRMLAKLGHKVMSLTRVAIGPIVLKGLAPGEYRPLSASEIGLLRKVAAGVPIAPPRSSDRPRSSRRGVARVQPQRRSSGPDAGAGPRLEGNPPPPMATQGPAPRGPRRAPVQPAVAPRRHDAGQHRRTIRPSGARPPRPVDPSPSQGRPVPPPPPGTEEPRRRIIGLESSPPPSPAGSVQPRLRRPLPKRRPHPRAGLGPRRPRSTQDEGE